MSTGHSGTGHDPLEGMTADGMIVTGARHDRIPFAFRPVIDKAVAQLSAMGPSHALYVYGSVATGSARVGSSDVDLVAIGVDNAAAHLWAQALSAEFAGLCRGVEIGSARLADHEGPGDEAYGNRVFLRQYCVHLRGPDAALGLPEFAADRAAARGFNGDIALCAARWRDQVACAAEPAVLGRRIARKTLLAVAALVSIHDTVWTTDRLGAARRWAQVKPRSAGGLDMLVAWSSGDNVMPSRAEVHGALDGVVADVAGEFERRIGLWRSTERYVA